MITIRNLSFSYSAKQTLRTLDNIDLEVKKGSLFGVLGPNGAGKTTLISIICGLLNPKAGNGLNIRINGLKLTELPTNFISLVPQEYAFYPKLSALENLQFFSGIQGLSGLYAKQRIAFALGFCQLSQVTQKRTETFSGGLKRRFNLAIGLLCDPELIFLDEPTVGIDPQSRAFILQQVKLLSEQGKTVVYTSHHMEEVEKLCDHLAIIDGGKVLRQDSLENMLAQCQQFCTLQISQTLPIDLQQLLNNRYSMKLQSMSSEKELLCFPKNLSSLELSEIIATLSKHQIHLEQVNYGQGNLERYFLELTNKALRD